MKKRILILMMLIVGIFFVSFGNSSKASKLDYCPYNQACDPRMPYDPDHPQCGDCSCQQICDPIYPFCKKKYVCGT